MSWLDRTKRSLLDPGEVNLNDCTYEIPFFGDSLSLETSIATVGLVNAPVLQEHPGQGLIPVLGRRRIGAAKAVGLQKIPVRIVPAEMPETDGYSLAFWDNCFRMTDSATLGYVVKRLLDLFPRERVCSTFLTILNVPPKGPRVERLRRVGGLERPILKALASGRLLEKTAVTLAAMDREDRELALDLSQRLRLNANTSEEVIGSLHDLAVLQQKSVGEIVTTDPILSVLHGEEHSVRERVMRLRDALRAMRFPEMVARECEFHEWCSRLALPDNRKIRHAPSFETDECTVEIEVADREEAHRIIQALQTVERS